MNEELTELLNKLAYTESRLERKRLLRKILPKFGKNSDQILDFLKNMENFALEATLRAIKSMHDAPFYAVAVMWSKSIDRDDEFKNLPDRAFRRIRDRKLKFRLLKKLSMTCEDEHEEMLIVKLLLSMRLPTPARLLAEHLQGPEHLDFQHIGHPETLRAYILAIELLTVA